jgi:hypothetical protein
MRRRSGLGYAVLRLVILVCMVKPCNPAVAKSTYITPFLVLQVDAPLPLRYGAVNVTLGLRMGI